MIYNPRNRSTLLIGAAVAAGVVGTLTTLLWPRHRGWASQVKGIANQVARGLRPLKRNENETLSKNFMIGGVAGGMIGATAALLLTPKSGKNLIKDLSDPFQRDFNRFRSKSRSAPSSARSAVRKASSRTRSTANPTTRKATAQHAVSSSSKKIPRRKSPSPTSRQLHPHTGVHHHSESTKKSLSRPSESKNES